MGIDINMTMGFGIHVPKEVFDKWLELNDPDEEGGWDVLDRFLRDYPGLTFDWPGNAWIGRDYGYLIYDGSTAKSFDMGREAEAGVYRPSQQRLTVEAQKKLSEVSIMITGEELPVEWLVGVAVS